MWIDVDESAPGRDYFYSATSLNNFGLLLQAMDDLDGARPYLERALGIWERQRGPIDPLTASGLTNVGLLLQAQGNSAEARPLLERALEIDETIYGPHHADVAIDLDHLGALAQGLGDLALAGSYYERALRVWQALGDQRREETARLRLGHLGA